MGLLNTFRNRSERLSGRYAISLDIGTEFVKSLIFKIEGDGEQGVVLGVGRERQKLGDMQSGAVTDIAGVVATCEKSLEQAAEMAGVRPEQAIIGIAGELVKGTTTTVRYERLKPKTKIDVPELKNIIQKVQWKAFDRVRHQLAWETGHPEIDIKLINAAIVDVRIDGYRVTNPIGFQGKDVTIGVFNAYAPLVHLGALQTIAAELELDLLSIAAEPYAVARCMGIEDAAEFSAIFIDVGGGTTDLAVVADGGVVGTKMFALGGRAFTKRLAQELNVNYEEAEQIKIKYSQDKLKPEYMKLVKDTLEGDIKVWLSGVELSLSEFSNIDLLPARILLCGGGTSLTGLQSVLQRGEWYKQLPFARRPQVNFIKPEDVVNIIDQTKKLQNPSDVTPMGLANLALDLAGDETMMSGILRRAVKMMQT